MSITVVFDPPLPSDNPATFNQKAFTLLGNLNTWSTQANALATEVNQDEAALNAAVNAAATSALNADTSASRAAASAADALNSANAASASATAAANSFDAFDDRYLGSKASNPATDNDGNALITGALYWNTTVNEMRVWDGASWQAAVGSLVGNADTATKLQTARTITIGNTGKSFDGSGDVSWSLAEIVGNRITGDFSNAIHANRVLFQTSTPDGDTAVGAIPNGTGNVASFVAWNGSDASNASFAQIAATAADVRLISGATGTGTLLPMTFWMGGAERMRIDSAGRVGIGKTPGAQLDWRSTINVISGNTAAVASNTYILTASLTLTLPSSPTAGDWVEIINRSGTTTPVVARNGQPIMGLAEDMTLDNANAALRLVFVDATRGWVWA